MKASVLFIVPWPVYNTMKGSRANYACYWHGLTGRRYDCIVLLEDPSNGRLGQMYVDDYLRTKLSPEGILVHAYNGTKENVQGDVVHR